MRFKNIKLLIVDMDNTLCDTFHTLSRSQWESVAKALEQRGHAKHARIFRKNFGKFSFKYTIERLDLPKSEIRFISRVYDSVSVRPLKLYKDAPGILNIPVKKVLVTRGDRSLQIKKIAHLRIKKYFDGIYYIRTFESKQDAFRAIMKKFKVKRDEALIIGDRIEEEIKDANEMGMPSVLVRRPDWPIHRGVATPTVTVRSLYSLAKKFK